jgi:anti-sigma regulatory factor (Ser/Thr protein kinase)
LAQLRAEVRRLLQHTDADTEDAVQVTDELASNALRHGHSPRICRLALLGQTRRLRIEVGDTSPTEPRTRVTDGSGGLGLVLIEHLATCWGVSHRRGRKTVWAELDWDRSAAGSGGGVMDARSLR